MLDTTHAAAVVGAIGGGVAALTGIFNVTYQYLSNRESIFVGFGSIRADELETDSLYVLNKSKFDVELKDYGFVTKGGQLFSIPLYCETESIGPEDDYFRKGDPRMPPRSIFRVGMSCSKIVVGAYAVTVTQSFPTVCIYQSHAFFDRILWKIKAKLWSQYC